MMMDELKVLFTAMAFVFLLPAPQSGGYCVQPQDFQATL